MLTDKTTKGLASCTKIGGCLACPYYDKNDDDCVRKVMKDALAERKQIVRCSECGYLTQRVVDGKEFLRCQFMAFDIQKPEEEYCSNGRSFR